MWVILYILVYILIIIIIIAYYNRKYKVRHEIEVFKRDQKILHTRRVAKLKEQLKRVDDRVKALITKHDALLFLLQVEEGKQKCYTSWLWCNLIDRDQ